MRDIKGVENAVSELSKNWPEIKEHFNTENEKYKILFNRDSSDIGRILKCHLILEHYLDNYISTHYNIDNLKMLRLSFYQKACMLPSKESPATVVRPGILQINSIRNKFSHNLEVTIQNDDLTSIDPLLEIARPEVMEEDIVRRIEAFTTVACTWLMVIPPELKDLYKNVFKKVIISRPTHSKHK